jgi:hypothetical protein
MEECNTRTRHYRIFLNCTENKQGQNPIWVKCRSATQKIDTTALFYCTKHGQNLTHPTDKCFTLKNRTEKPKELQVRLNKKNPSAKRKLLRENVFRPHNGQDNGRVRDSNGKFR